MTGRIIESTFQPPWWLRGPHAQTLFPNTLRRVSLPVVEWEVFELSDGDFLELAWTGPPDGPIAVVLHGLGGSYESPPVRGMSHALSARGWRVCCFHFRGCGRGPNRTLTAYHSGMTSDPLEVFRALGQRFLGFFKAETESMQDERDGEDHARLKAAAGAIVAVELHIKREKNNWRK